ncbi:LacI family DNA-binding transcriptional regulator [Paenibacillus crassostreae]|uniref:Transcriptional regulator n=1 Tax=Paenibacillus crassostreae TaxID=1763538 RepID=A0A167DR62_9BACL|nr:LacI family DNA-binding transcriptional regulator [Paenibacillus crassostreae]AOZ91155.1 transcriptional regulator [Paenibacillus crassostreae]OAB74685.1 transcriptional regulator [Paenibacillus crassostreae]
MSNLDLIAKMAGFSKATVSRVLNQSPHVSQETRNKILSIMKELDYVPNRNAISLSKGQTMQIGISTEGINNLMLPFLNGFVEIASQYGYQTIIYTSGGDAKKELQPFEDLRRKRVDALVIITSVNDPSLLRSYCKYGPIVSWQRMDQPDISSVAMDQYEGYWLALEHLIEKGYNRIANAFGRPNSINTHNRMRAYADMMGKHHLTVSPKWSFSSVYTIRDGEQVVRDLLEHKDDLPDAILCANDYVAAGALCEARRQQLKVPEDLAIVGFDNTELAHTMGITSIHNPIAAQAQNAFYLLLLQLLDTEVELEILQFSLIQRFTT